MRSALSSSWAMVSAWSAPVKTRPSGCGTCRRTGKYIGWHVTLPAPPEGLTFDGTIYAPNAESEATPGLLLVHGGAGLDEHAHEQAHRWASTGYSVLACDMYGHGVAGDRARVMSTVTRLRDDPDEIVRRARAALDVLGTQTDGHPVMKLLHSSI